MRAVVAVRAACCGVEVVVTEASSVLEKVRMEGDWKGDLPYRANLLVGYLVRGASCDLESIFERCVSRSRILN